VARQTAAGLGQLRPGQFPGRGASRPYAGQRRFVDRVEDSPCGGIRGHRAEQPWLLPQHRQISDGFTAVGEQHREIDGDTAGLMRRPTLPVQPQCLNETPAQSRLISKIGEQSGADMTDHTPSPTTDDNLRTRAGTLHLESAFRAGRSGP
jgi:hypothetical protein